MEVCRVAVRKLFLLGSNSNRCLAPFIVLPKRGRRYDAKGNTLPGRKIPLGWRKVDHNPANIPSAWIPDSWKEESVIDYEREKELAKYIPGYEPILPEHEHPDYHPETLFHFTPKTKLVEGFRQALNLVKCVLIEEMPRSIKDLSANVAIPNQDERVIQVFRHALLFDIDPKIAHSSRKKKIFKQDQFLIYPGVERYCPTILDNLIRLCHSQSDKHPSVLKRLIAREVEMSATFRRGITTNTNFAEHLPRNWKVSISGQAGIQILTTEPLKRFADEDAVKKTESTPIPDIFPVFPIVDLTKLNVYKETSSTGFSPGFSHNHLHTLVMNNLNEFTAEENYGRMACFLFANLHSRAVAMYGDTPMDLPTPVVGQCIASDGQNFQFLCMQLNTTRLEDDSGIKNMAWIPEQDEDIETEEEYSMQEEKRTSFTWLPMYAACSHRVWQSPEYYTDYDPKVFQLFLSLMLNGAA